MLLLLTSLFTPPLSAAETPDGLVEAALSAHPTLAALESQVDTLEAAALGAGTWMDPRVGLEVSNLPLWTFGLGDHPMAGVQVKVQQTLPAPGTSAADRQAADLRAQAATHQVAEARDTLARQVSRAWWDLTLSRQLETVTADHLARTEDLLDAVLARYEVGEAGQSAVVRLEVLRDRLRDDLGDFNAHQASLTAALLSATQGAVAPPFDTPTDVRPAPLTGTAAAWLEQARAARPELVRLEAEARASEAAASAAALAARPDPTVWLGYRLRTFDDDPRDLVTVGVSVPLPVGSRTRADAQEAMHTAQSSATRHALDARLLTLDAELTAAQARWGRAAQKSEAYETRLLPAAQASLETTLSDYSVGRATFASLYESQVTLLTLERAWRTAVVETWRTAADVRALLGQDPTGETL
jgi:outer membrane protein, heavy metal efflux system